MKANSENELLYGRWSGALSETPLFGGLSGESITLLPQAMRPRVRAGRPKLGEEDGAFWLVVECDPPKPVSLGRDKYSMPERFTPGMLFAEVSSLVESDGRTVAPCGKSGNDLPELPLEITTLELTPEMLMADYGPHVARLQIVLLGNLARMMAQKVVDGRKACQLSIPRNRENEEEVAD